MPLNSSFDRSIGFPPAGQVDIAVPVKRFDLAKSRLQVPAELRRELAEAFLVDTLKAAVNCPLVRTVTVVTDDTRAAAAAWRLGVGSFTQRTTDPDLNRDLARYRDSCSGDFPLAVLLGDLPALTAVELTVALSECLGHLAAFAADRRGHGTTMLYSRRATALRPAFGTGSAQAHRAGGAHQLMQVGLGLSQDVDTLNDLRTTRMTGVGTHTTAALAAHPDLPRPSRNATMTGVRRHAQPDTGYKPSADQFGAGDLVKLSPR
jgi:2-phospho-L-lactate guanylyltransferase